MTSDFPLSKDHSGCCAAHRLAGVGGGRVGAGSPMRRLLQESRGERMMVGCTRAAAVKVGGDRKCFFQIYFNGRADATCLKGIN